MAGISPGHPTVISASLWRLFRVVAGAGSQVRGNRDHRIGDQGFVKAPVGIRVVVDDLQGVDNAVRILLDFVGRRARSIPLVGQRVDVGQRRGICIEHCPRIDATVAGVLIPGVVGVESRLDEELEQLVGCCIRPLLAGEREDTGDDGRGY